MESIFKWQIRFFPGVRCTHSIKCFMEQENKNAVVKAMEVLNV